MRSKTPAPNRVGILVPRAGWLLKYHCGSASDTGKPPRPRMTRDRPAAMHLSGAGSPRTPRRILFATESWSAQRELRHELGQRLRVEAEDALTPATSDAAGSKPSGGRVKFVRWLCEIAVKLI